MVNSETEIKKIKIDTYLYEVPEYLILRKPPNIIKFFD